MGGLLVAHFKKESTVPKLLCTLPNASEEISGIKFVSHANGMLSENVSAEVAAEFAAIPGYELVGGGQHDDGAAAQLAAAAAEADAARHAAQEEADRLAADATTNAEADAKVAAAEVPEKAAADDVVKTDRAAKVAKAIALGVHVKGNWGDARLDSEIEAAEKKKLVAASADATEAASEKGDSVE